MRDLAITGMEFVTNPPHIGYMTLIQVICCFLASAGIWIALIRIPATQLAHNRIPLAFAGAGLFITGTGFLCGNLEAVKIGHILENFGLSLWVWLTIAKTLYDRHIAPDAPKPSNIPSEHSRNS